MRLVVDLPHARTCVNLELEMLVRLRIPDVDTALPSAVCKWLEFSRSESRVYWDLHSEAPAVELSESDHRMIAEQLTRLTPRVRNESFLEWGCGLATMTGVAALMGLRSVGIEIDPRLCRRARKHLASASIQAVVLNDSFLPAGSDELSEPQDPRVSLRHGPGSAAAGAALQSAGTVFVYSWPGEEHFLKLVFERNAEPETLLMLYRGADQIEVYLKR